MSETLNTLRYAARAKRIRTKPVVVMVSYNMINYPRMSTPGFNWDYVTIYTSQDPREALIVSLKREVTALREENSILRLQVHSGNPGAALSSAERTATWLQNQGKGPSTPGGSEPPHLPPPPQLDKATLDSMEPTQLKETIDQFLTENSALRQENWELIAVRDLLIRDQELVCRENERLLKKLEDVNSVCCRSPIANVARPSYSAGEMSSNGDGSGPGLTKSQSDDDIVSRGGNIGGGIGGGVQGRIQKKGGGGGGGKNHTLLGVKAAAGAATSQQMPDVLSRELEKRRIGQG